MCKFNQLFVLFICCVQLVQIGVAIPLGTLLFDEYADDQGDYDYDLNYDQRQNGTENYRLNINGVVIALPAASSDAMSSVGLLASNYLLELAAANEAAANEEASHDESFDEVEHDNNPYDFEIAAGSQENEDTNESIEPVVSFSADSIIDPSTSTATSETVLLDLQPEYNVDVVNEKQSATNKKDLKVEDKKEATEPVVVSISADTKIKPSTTIAKNKSAVQDVKPKNNVNVVSAAHATENVPSVAPVSPKAPTKRKIKTKQTRIAALLGYLKGLANERATA